MTTKKNHKTSGAANIQRFNFHGDDLDIATTPDGEHWVVLARLCEPFDLDTKAQRDKLKALSWARWVIIPSLDASRREQDLFCLNIRSVAGWLFTLNAGKVAEHLREKLVRYQRECADVLADHFLGRRGANDPGQISAAITSAVTPIARAVESMTLILAAQGRRIDALEARLDTPQPANDAPGIGAEGARKVLGTLRDIAATKAGALGQGGNVKVKARLRFIEERNLRRELRYPMDRGCSWGKITEEQFGRAMLILERVSAEADDMARLAARETGPLFRAVPTPAPTNDAAKKSGT